jgi:predicted dinucleotide-binding enzyme
MSSISIIGTGNMARAIGARALAGGNTVEIIGRDGAKAADLAETLGAGARAGAGSTGHVGSTSGTGSTGVNAVVTTGRWGATPAGDIVIVALLHDAVVPAVSQYGDALAGKVVVDISNPFNPTFDGLAHREPTSVAQEAARAAPAADVVKAFNTVFRHVLENGRPDVFMAGDSARAKASVAAFVESLGLRPLDVGGLRMAHWLEGAGLLTVGLANHAVGHLDFALGVAELRADAVK